MLSSKTEVGDQLKDYVTWAERQLSRPVRKILSDSGTEFVNAEVKRWCSGTGIEWVTVAPGGSSVNYAERAIQTLRNSMKSMLKHSGLPLSFWPDALRNACYVRNRVVCNSTMRTPFELFYNKKPDVHRIRTFGALTYAHIPKDLRIKSADTSDVGFLLGYSEENMGSKVYFPQYHTARMVYTVRVNEGILYRDRNALPSSIVRWIADQHSVEEGESKSIEDSVSESDSDADNDMEPCESEVDGNDDRMSMKRPRVFVRPFLDDDNEIETTEEIPAGVTSNNNSEYASEGNTVDSCDSNIRNSDADEVDSSGPGDAAAIVCGDNSDSLGDTVSEDEIKDALENLDTNRTVEADDNTEVVDNSDYLTKDDDAYNEPVDIEEEIWGLENNGQSATEQEVDLVQNMRSFSETPRHGEKHERESIIDRREDSKKPRYEPRELKRPKRERRLPKYLEDYVVNATLGPTLIGKQWQASKVKIPRTFREAMRLRQADEWKAAMEREMQALRDKGVLKLIAELPAGQHVIDTRWVYDVKTDEDGYIVRFRARVLARGFKQIPGLDFLETFSPVARMSTLRLLLALACALGWKLWSGDVNNAYLNAKLKIKQYIRHIDGVPDEDGVFRVDQALYGLKQSGREWNEEIDSWMKQRGFQQCKSEPCLYFYACDGVLAFVLLYVDDVICTSDSETFKSELFEDLQSTYGFKDMCLLTSYLGIRVQQSDSGIAIDQEEYARKLCEKFDLKEGQSNRCGIPIESSIKLKKCEHENDGCYQHVQCKVPYREAIGGLMYLVTATRPDLMFVVGQLSRFVEHPTEQHAGALKRVMRYLLGTVGKGIQYEKRESLEIGLHLQGHSDSDWANDVDTRKSTTGYVFTLMGGAVTWASRRQTIVAQSTAEAEYVAACEAAMEGKALMNILDELLHDIKHKISLGVDNQSSYVMAANPTFGRRTRHIELKWHFVREQVMKKELYLFKVKSVDNPADLFTKPLTKQRFELLSKFIGMVLSGSQMA